MSRQIDFAVDACKDVVKKLHIDGDDRTCIATFGSRFTIEQPYTQYESSALSSLERIRSKDGGCTRLYDSILDAIKNIEKNRRSNCAEVLLVLTDGHDNESSRFRNASAYGSEIYRQYYSRPNAFLFVIGVGNGVNQRAMDDLKSTGKFAYLHVDNFSSLPTVLALLALKIQEQTQAMIISNGSSAILAAQRSRRLGKIPVDYTLLIDISSSMQERAIDTRCPKNHKLVMRNNATNWDCGVCGKPHQNEKSEHSCSQCNFDACNSHFKKEGGKPTPEATCPKNHPMFLEGEQATAWICDDCRKFKIGKRFHCSICNHDLCHRCNDANTIGALFFRAMLSSAMSRS
ncbi:hypothetical protein HK098_006595 [Nowakowskiella sp. JEL0407]|nr:hypothetical protein HK098_006595 [Nowakowskiella sp. JEL0407]